MIRINLYQGGQKSKRGRRSGALSLIGVGRNFRLSLIVALVAGVTVAGNVAYYWSLQRETTQIQAGLHKADADYARLTQVKLRYQEREKEKDLYKKRVDVIDDLRSNQSGPVNLLATLGDTVNRNEQVWLTTMGDDGANINITGVALSIHGVADLMRNLQNTGFFKTVDIKSSYQDEKVQDMQAFIFELTCQKLKPTGQATQAATPKAAAPQAQTRS